MDRRKFLSAAGVGTAAVALATPAIAQDKRQWKMVTAWPKNLPGPGVAAQTLADRITTLSGGRIEVTLYAAGELVPGRGVFDAVSEGTAELYHAVPAYWGSKSKGILLFGSQPFGLRADEQFGWMYHGGGQALYDEMRAFRAACGDAHVKAILATGELGTLRNVARASLICMMAGADFIKTSTGKEPVNATLPVTLTMIRAIRDYEDRTGVKVGYKPAGGISKAKDALVYLSMIKDELGDRWLQPDLFRFGASSLLGDIERQLEHHVTGAYSAQWRHAIG